MFFALTRGIDSFDWPEQIQAMNNPPMSLFAIDVLKTLTRYLNLFSEIISSAELGQKSFPWCLQTKLRSLGLPMFALLWGHECNARLVHHSGNCRPLGCSVHRYSAYSANQINHNWNGPGFECHASAKKGKSEPRFQNRFQTLFDVWAQTRSGSKPRVHALHKSKFWRLLFSVISSKLSRIVHERWGPSKVLLQRERCNIEYLLDIYWMHSWRLVFCTGVEWASKVRGRNTVIGTEWRMTWGF